MRRSSVPAILVASGLALSASARAALSPFADTTRLPQLVVLAGAAHWNWQEFLDGSQALEEKGFLPAVAVEFVDRSPRWRLGVEARGAFGAIEYDGQLQNGTPFSTQTHYFPFDLLLHVRKVVRNGGVLILPGVSGGWHRWVRTIDSDEFDVPGDRGYVETWSTWTVDPTVGVEVPVGSGRGGRLGLEAALLVPLGTEETVAMAGVDQAPVLEPDLTPGWRLGARLRLDFGLQFDARWTSMEWKPSPVVTRSVRVRREDGSIGTEAMSILQPNSVFGRADLLVGWEF